MSATDGDTGSWSPLKWVLIVAVLFVIQAGLFLWLGKRKPLPAAVPKAGVVVQMSPIPDDSRDLENPLLLLTPNVHGFSRAWMTVSNMTHEPPAWAGASNAELARPVRPLGGDVALLVTNSVVASYSVVDRPHAESGPLMLAPEPGDEEGSTLTIGGDLAGRKLISMPMLLTQYSDSRLSNSVVEIDVDAEGNVFDPPIIGPNGKSGSPESDTYARQVARTLRFAALPQAGGSHSAWPAAKFTTGTVTFHWRTEPPALSNSSPSSP